MPSNEVSFTVDFKNVKLVQEIIKKFTDEATRLEERNGILYSHIELLNKALDVLCPLVARTIDFLPSEQFTLIAATREALDNVTYIQNKEYRENTNPDYYKDEGAGVSEQYGCPDCNYVEYIDKIPIQCPICGHTSMERLRWTKGGDGSHWEGCEDVHWDCKIAQLEAELARRNEERNALADENRMLSERIQRLVEGAKSRDEIIARLKEDGDSLASVVTGGVTQDAEEYWECPYCMAMAYNAGDIHHTPDCPITLHRALMKELEC